MKRQLSAIKSLSEAKTYIKELRKAAQSRNAEISLLRKALREEQANKKNVIAQLAEADERQSAQAQYITHLESRVEPEQHGGILQWIRRVFALN